MNIEQFKGLARLPKFAIRSHYDLHLKLDLSAACTFSGTVKINLSITEKTNFLVLNANQLQVHQALFTTSGNQQYCPSDVVVDDDDEVVVLVFDETLCVGEGLLGIEFSGKLNEHLKGLYRCTYVDEGVKKNMAVTQFEAADARRYFPCWDEPALKATFKITFDGPSELTTLSNMPIIDEKLDGNVKTVYFEYFSTPYPLPKLDMVAVPEFAAGAMENFGLIVYRDNEMLYSDSKSTARRKQRMSIVVAHEVAHHWFGNLVTMEWWTHLWLNEGFATWVSYMATDNLFPEWNIWTNFLRETTGGLSLDALEQSHPVEVEVHHVHGVEQVFDDIGYRKGSAIIRMLQGYLGDDIFQSQFLSSGLHDDGEWIVPITLALGSYDKRKNFLLESKFGTVEISEFFPSSAETLWIKVNVEQSGFYGVMYEDRLAAQLRKAVENNCLLATDKFESLASSPDPDIVLEVLNFLLSDELSSNEKAEEVEAFFGSHVNPAVDKILKQSIERIQIKARWIQSIKQEQSLPDLVNQLLHKE
ncbi:hypothetical protein LWI29_011907 [Acer saccharum]|uniref:Peptidase M1 membrane alanine aminopeptidase domain-containing protein n=1 Tax=Acer saccharum TaxID=4024 RepID=A0AA39SMI0_ACESA|nr:hypothetical protein LWI29_011907 [Acer saccharum]